MLNIITKHLCFVLSSENKLYTQETELASYKDDSNLEIFKPKLNQYFC